ncbi:unnamed protein product [Merluccius merluccius]
MIRPRQEGKQWVRQEAFPLYPDANQREAAWANPKDNDAQEKTEFNKDVDKAYKSYMDSGDLYTADEQEGRGRGTVAEEMRRKLNAESERLRARLRQELAELRERLSPHPASLSGNVQELCGQLSLYIQGLERAEAQAQAGPPVYREAFHGMSQTLENGGIKLDDIIGDFQSKTSAAMDPQREAGERGDGVEEEQSGRTWPEMRSRLAQEVSSARLQAQSRWGVLNAELGALLLVTSPPLKTTEVTANVDEFCQSAALQNQVFLARLERVFLGLEEEREASAALSSPSDPSLPGSLLQEDFSAKFSALIQDILHSVQ